MIARIDNPGIAQPEFEEIIGAVVVTFRVLVAETAGVSVGSKAGARVESKVESKVGAVADLPSRVSATLRLEPASKAQIAAAVGKKRIDGQLHAAVREVLARGLVVSTLPDKPNSRLQEYRLTAEGRNALTARP